MAMVGMVVGAALSAGATGFVAGAFNPLTFGLLVGGQLLSNALTPRQVIGRISDVGVQTVNEGSPIKKAYGEMTLAGAIVWSDGKTERIESGDAGKGAPSSPDVATYTSSFQLLMGEAPPDNRVERVLKIYMNQHLLYSYNDGDEDGGSLVYNATDGCWSMTSGLLKNKFRLYDGSQTKVDSHVAIREAKIYKEGQTNELSSAYTDRLLGFVRTDVAPAKSYFEQLSSILWCDFVSVGGKVVAKPRDTAPKFSFHENDLKWAYNSSSEPLGNNTPQLTIERARARDAAGRVEWNFMDAGRRFNPALRRATRQGGDLRNVVQSGVSAAQSSGWAQTCANVDLWRMSVENQTLSGTSYWANLWISPGDVITLTRLNGEVLEYRVVQRIVDMIGTVSITAVSHDGKIYRLEESANTGTYSGTVVTKIAAPILFGASAPALCDTGSRLGGVKFSEMLDQPVLWAGMAARKGSKFINPKMALCKVGTNNPDGKADAGKVRLNAPARIGFLKDSFTVEGPTDGWQNKTIRVRMFSGDLGSATRNQVEANRANIILFETGRFLQYQTAVSEGTYTEDGVEVEQWALTDIYEGFAGSDFPESAPGGIIPEDTRLMLITDSEGDLVPGVALIDVDYSNPPEFTRMVGAFADKGAEFKSSDDVVTYRNLPTPYKARNMEPLPPVLSRLERDSGGIRVVGWPSTRIYWDDAFDLPIGGELSEPLKSQGYEFAVTVSPISVAAGSENDSNSRTFTEYYEDESMPFDFFITNHGLGLVPGLGEGDPVRVSVSMIGKYLKGRKAYISEV